MACEVEVKAHITKEEYASLKADFTSRMEDLGFEEKQDMYFRKDGATEENMRIRKAGQKWMLTYKERSTDEGTEINKEVELEVSDGATARKLLESMGFERSFEKVKKVHLFVHNKTKHELVEIVGLGFFIEIEIIVENEENVAQIAEAKKMVTEAFAGLHIASKTPEERSYKKMLGHS